MPPLHALAFLTRVPVPGTPPTMTQVAAAQAWFPAVGLLIGAFLVGVDRLAMRALPPAAVDVLLVVALVVITGALHLDGLADAADGLFGGESPERRLAIMRDVHRGSFAIVAVASVFGLKWAGFAALPPDVRVEALLVAPCLARLAVVVAAAAYPYARREGTGAAFHARAWPRGLAGAAAIAAVASVASLGTGGLAAVAFAAGAALVAGFVALRLVGGMTGDLYGATVEVAEAATLLFVAALANRGWIEAWALA